MSGAIRAFHPSPEVVVLELVNPDQRNALDDAMIEELGASLDRCVASPGLRVLVIRGAGAFFCGGRSISEFVALQRAERPHVIAEYAKLARIASQMAAAPFPVIAAIEGFAIGAGAMLASWCDIVLADERAFLSYPEGRLGISPQLALVHLARHVSRPVAMDLLCTGRRLGAREAAQFGLVSRVATAEGFEQALNGMVADILQSAPGALALMKRTVSTVSDATPAQSFEHAVSEIADSVLSAEASEGVSAFLEKRAPTWRKHAPPLSTRER